MGFVYTTEVERIFMSCTIAVKINRIAIVYARSKRAGKVRMSGIVWEKTFVPRHSLDLISASALLLETDQIDYPAWLMFNFNFLNPWSILGNNYRLWELNSTNMKGTKLQKSGINDVNNLK